MEKDIAYYQQVAENFYLSHFDEIKARIDKERAESRKALKERNLTGSGREYNEIYHEQVIVNTHDESCFFPNRAYPAVRPHELLFYCVTIDGKVKISLLDYGEDKVAEMLGLVDLYDKTERVEVDYVRKEDGYLHLVMPEKLRQTNTDFYKIKLYKLDEFVNECNYTGWGDCFTQNVLEVIAGIMNQDCIDMEKNEIKDSLNWLVGPGDTGGMNYYAEFEFSHCEVAKDSEEDSGWAVYICYTYNGLEEYDD